MDPREMAVKIAGYLDAKKGEDIVVLEVGRVTTLAEYFVIVSASNTRLVSALADEVDMKLSAEGIEPHHIEGYQSANWILMDYDDVIVHVFYSEQREFYNLERLWSDAPALDLEAERL